MYSPVPSSLLPIPNELYAEREFTLPGAKLTYSFLSPVISVASDNISCAVTDCHPVSLIPAELL